MMEWVRSNIGVVAAWIVLGLGAAVTVGVQSAEIAHVRQEMDRRTPRCDRDHDSIAVLRMDVRTLQERSTSTSAAVAEIRVAIRELRVVLSAQRVVTAEQRAVTEQLRVVVGRLSERPK
ncbi:MAG: hypothetical protein ABIL09_11165 [Gemmatimonadota bacterium]